MASESKFVTPSPPSGQGIWIVTDDAQKTWVSSLKEKDALINIGVIKDPTVYPFPPDVLRGLPDVPGSRVPKNDAGEIDIKG